MAVSSRRLLRLLGLFGISVLCLLFAALVALELPEVSTWVGRRLLTLVPLNPGYQLSIGRIDGNWLTGISGRELKLTQGSRTLAEVERFRVGYSVPALLGSER